MEASNLRGSVLVIGGGVTGIQAALDIADQGFKVYLVEKDPSIGGVMARLDKTFPTNDCSICIEAPKMVEVLRHPNIELLTYHEVKELKGSAGNFKVKLLRKPRYVDQENCSGCGKCADVCPVSVPSEFDLGTGLRKAIYLPFPQAVPMKYTLDPLCRGGNYKDRGACVGTCIIDCVICRSCPVAKCISACRDEGRNAVVLWQRPKKIEIEVGSIIVATGFEVFEPTMKPEYGYGIFKNVITALQYERLLSASGPSGGKVLRPSDNKVPKKVAWIQCIGSRDIKAGVPYCSRICCMYSTKEAIITKEHDPSIETYIFYTHFNTYGKGFVEYIGRAKNLGIEYIRSKPAEIYEDPETKDLSIRYENIDTAEIKEMKVNMVVLSSAVVPSKGNKELAEILGIELDEYGFFKEKDPLFAPLETKIEGVYLSGCCLGPADIPDSISKASAAAAKAVTPIVEARGKEVRKVELPPEIEVKPSDEPRIGAFVCDCGTNIRGVIDVPRVVEYLKTLSNVVFAEEGQYICSADYQNCIKDVIKQQSLNRVLVACCTPRTHELLFRRTCREVGLNPYLLEFTSLREHCSWVHMNQPEEATAKAKDLVRMGVAKARLLGPEEEFTLPVGKECLVIGGGVAGMTAALTLADMDFKVKLVEKDNELGGMLRKINKCFPFDISAQEIISQRIKDVDENENIEIYTGTEIKNITGYVGNFSVTICNKSSLNEEFKVSTIIVATGMNEIDPTGLYEYGKHNEIVTQLQLEQMLKNGMLKEPKNVVMINCVGAREESSRTYCCRVGCGTSIKNAKYIKQLYPDAKIHILYRDMLFGEKEVEYYKDVKENYGINFIRYSENRKPKVYEYNGKLMVNVYDITLGDEIRIEPDLVVLTPVTEGSGKVEELKKILRIPIGEGNFFQEAHVKLRPLEFATDGIYLSGCAHSPKGAIESIHQAVGAAMKASIPMGQGMIISEGITAEINPEKCDQCGICAKVCPHGAIKVENEIHKVIPVLCKGCGTCSAECPRESIIMRHFTDEQIIAQIEQALAEKPEEKILVFACNWCSYVAADTAGVSRFQYPPNIRIIRTMCSGRVAPKFIYKAFELGAGIVLVAGCEFPTCHYIFGNYTCEKRIEHVKRKLAKKGVDPDRLQTLWISAAQGKKFSESVSRISERLLNSAAGGSRF